MAEDRYIDSVPDGITIGGIISLVLGFIPIVNFFGAFLGGAAATYIEEYGIVKSIGAGIAVGLLSLVPLLIYAVIGILVTGGGAAFNSDIAAGLGVFGGVFGGLFALISLFVAPVSGASGGFSLGIYFHLIHKASD